MNWSLLLGLLVVLAGASIILNALFHIDVPLFRSAFALFLIFAGARILVDAWSPSRRDTSQASAFSESLFKPTNAHSGLKYDVVFGKSVVDLTSLAPPSRDTPVEVNAIFGVCVVRVDPSLPYVVDGSAAFGEVHVPQQRAVAFGDVHYAPEGQSEQPKLRLKLNAVFGSCQLEEVGAGTPVSLITPHATAR